MESINSFYTPQMRSGETVAFHTDTLNEIENADVEQLFPQSMETYRNAVKNLQQTYDVVSASELSVQARLLDGKRDKCWSTFRAHLKVCVYGDDVPATKAAADKVWFVLRSAMKEVGDPIELGMTRKSAAIESIIRNLLKCSDEIELIGAKPYLEKLEGVNSDFAEMQIARDVEKGSKPSGNMKTARAVAREAYRTLKDDINAWARFHQNENIQLFSLIRTHNATIEKYRNLVAQRKGRNVGKS